MEKLDVHDMKNLQDKLVNLRKQLKPSAVNRKLEFQKFKMKREDEMNNRTERELLNIFKTETSFANYACCYKCNSNLTIWIVEEVKVDEAGLEEHQPQNQEEDKTKTAKNRKERRKEMKQAAPQQQTPLAAKPQPPKEPLKVEKVHFYHFFPNTYIL